MPRPWRRRYECRPRTGGRGPRGGPLRPSDGLTSMAIPAPASSCGSELACGWCPWMGRGRPRVTRGGRSCAVAAPQGLLAVERCTACWLSVSPRVRAPSWGRTGRCACRLERSACMLAAFGHWQAGASALPGSAVLGGRRLASSRQVDGYWRQVGRPAAADGSRLGLGLRAWRGQRVLSPGVQGSSFRARCGRSAKALLTLECYPVRPPGGGLRRLSRWSWPGFVPTLGPLPRPWSGCGWRRCAGRGRAVSRTGRGGGRPRVPCRAERNKICASSLFDSLFYSQLLAPLDVMTYAPDSADLSCAGKGSCKHMSTMTCSPQYMLMACAHGRSPVVRCAWHIARRRQMATARSWFAAARGSYMWSWPMVHGPWPAARGPE